MCGICGFISKRTIKYDNLKAMNDTMYHRGPDDGGVEIYDLRDGYSLGMAHRRLSIMDLSIRGHQPMHSFDRRISLVFNGEIYNFNEIRNQLPEYPFKSNCDTEVIIAAYLTWGIECVDKFNGMFAIALYDREIEKLYLIRDRIGKKPLYYYKTENEFVFASTISAIRKYPFFKEKLNKEVIGEYLYRQYIVSPKTIFKNVKKVCPGQIIELSHGSITEYKYWDVKNNHNDNKFTGNYEDAKSELKHLLSDSVKKRMVADVPVGVFLSGGFDSTLIASLAQDISEQPIKTFCIGVEEKEFNEAVYAKEIAKILGTDHTELYITEKDMLALLDEIPTHYDEPFADVSQIPTMLVAKLATQQVTVALFGDGGDELFCGYRVYDMIKRFYNNRAIGKVLAVVENTSLGQKTGFMQSMPPFARVLARNSMEKNKLQYNALFVKPLIDRMLCVDNELFYDESELDMTNWQKARMLMDQMTYLPDDIMCKVDRATMAYSLESRAPILDYRVVEFANVLPHNYKFYNGIKKRILKDIVYSYVPKEMMDRPKQGFGIPIEKWMMNSELRERMIDYSDIQHLKGQDIFDAEYVNKIVNEYLQGRREKTVDMTRIMWSFVTLEQWLDKSGGVSDKIICLAVKTPEMGAAA